MKRIFHIVTVVGFLFAGFAVFGLVMFLDGYYYRTSPRGPDPTTGKIYSYQVKTAKGVARVYLTRSQILPSQLIFWVCPILFLTAYFLNKRWKVYRNPQDDMPKKLS